MRVDPGQQQLVYELQGHDTALAKLRHKRRTLPILATLEELAGRGDDLRRAMVTNESEVSDIRREVRGLKDHADKLRDRRDLLGKRLESGKGLSRELVALQDEIAQLAVRLDNAEIEQLEAEERLEACLAKGAAIGEQHTALDAEVAQATERRDSEWMAVDEDIRVRSAQRGEVSMRVEARLLADYERQLEFNGGLAVVGVIGRELIGASLQLSLQQWAQLDAAPADELVEFEDFDYWFVRVK